jgi:hypothetical protein
VTDTAESAAGDRGLRLRGHGDRRHHDRRALARSPHNRRRRRRRRQKFQGFAFGALIMALPGGAAKLTPKHHGQQKGQVTVTMGQFRPIAADEAYNDLIKEAAATYDIDPNLIRAVMRAESAFNPLVVSRAGAEGLMQLMPALQEELGVEDPFDPAQNVLAGARYLKWLLDRHRGNLDLAIASYNAGPGAVARYKAIPPYRETRNYVKTVKQFLAETREETANGD